jgi:hypothetical protein
MPRPRPLENRLGQVEGHRSAVADEQSAAAARERRLLRAKAALGEIIRAALAQAGVDAASATRLALAEDAAATLAAIPDDPQLRHADAGDGVFPASPNGRARADDFAPKIVAMTRCFAGGEAPDFARASFAELLAWSLAQKAGESPPARSADTSAATGERVGET